MMELPVSLQAWQFALSFVLGFVLAAVYDLFRALRRGWRLLTRPLDALYCLILLAALLLFALYPGRGDFRVFFYPGILLGALLWFLTLSPLFLAAGRAGTLAFQNLGLLRRPAAIFLQKNKKMCKLSLFNRAQIG